jgi:DedD protein
LQEAENHFQAELMSLFKHDHSDDPKTKLRRRARQRLIGAIILVLTAVIVIPMMLDTEPRPIGQDIAVTIPSRSTPFVPRLESPPSPTATAVIPDAAPASAVNAPEAKPVAASEAVKVEEKKVEEKKPEMPKPETVKPEAAKAEVAKGNVKHESKPLTADKPAESEAAKALAALEGRETKAPAKFFVQVGAFSNEEKVKELQANLRAAGVETFTEKLKVSSGVRLRVRAGPFASHAEAEQILAKVGGAGIAGALVVSQ